jgi:rRNA maturation protein Nop10
MWTGGSNVLQNTVYFLVKCQLSGKFINPPTFSTALPYMKQRVAQIGQWTYLLYGGCFKKYCHSYYTNGALNILVDVVS